MRGRQLQQLVSQLVSATIAQSSCVRVCTDSLGVRVAGQRDVRSARCWPAGCFLAPWRQRRVREWRALRGPEREVFFEQEHVIAGKLEARDVAALRRFVCLTQEQFAEALGISVHTLRNWEQDRVARDGPGLALLRIAARHPRIVRENIGTAA